jgi:hypothetical protein
LHCNSWLIRTKERIWIIFLKGKFQLIFSHKAIHEGQLVKKGIITIDRISKIKGKKKNSKMKLFWIFSKINACSFCFKQWRTIWIMLHSNNNCVCETIRLMLQLKLYQICISLYNIFNVKIKVQTLWRDVSIQELYI